MPAAIIKGKLHKKCEVCSKPAQFGKGVDLRLAMHLVSQQKIDMAKDALGQWWCYTHLPKDHLPKTGS